MRVRCWALGLVALALGTSTAAAQKSVTLDRFSASAMPADDFQIDRPLTPGHLKLGAMVHLDYARDPLEYSGTTNGGDEVKGAIVSDQLTANAALSLGLGKRGLLYVGLPVVAYMNGDDDPSVGSTALPRHDDPGLGNAYLGARVRLFGDEDAIFALALQAAISFPSAGKSQRFRGDEFLTGTPELLLALRPGLGSRITFNLGGNLREKSSDPDSNLAFGQEFTYGVGFAIPVFHGRSKYSHFDFHAQFFGTTTFKDVEQSPMEALGGFKYFHQSGFIFGAAGGPGITRGFGTPTARGVLMLGYQMPGERDQDGDGLEDAADACPSEPEDADGYQDDDGCPDPDNDADDIPDVRDRCPNDPETLNEVDDEDGCPDIVGDADSDGLIDTEDACPSEPEDVDGYQDEDGCPDPDNDGDGLLDREDRCPMDAGPADNGGCPDPDRDGDGTVDRLDNCPDEPGPPENQGCAKKQRVKIEKSNLRILEKVYFTTGKARIQRRSYALLDNVAEVLVAHPEIPRVVVEGHTDSRGRREFNLKLSQARAEAVRSYLVRRGVDADRLEAVGHGPDRPRIENARTRDELAENRRVEFVIPEAQPGASNPLPPETR